MLFANTFFGRFIQPNHGRFTSSNASDFPKCGCKGTTFFRYCKLFRKIFVPLQPIFNNKVCRISEISQLLRM